MTECSLCDEESIGFFRLKDKDHVPLCRPHAEILIFGIINNNNNKGRFQRFKEWWNTTPSGMKPRRYEKTPLHYKILLPLLILLWIGAGIVFFIGIFASYPIKAALGFVGQIVVMVGGTILMVNLHSYKKFWMNHNGWFTKRNFWITTVLGMVLIVIPILLWITDIIWLVDMNAVNKLVDKLFNR